MSPTENPLSEFDQLSELFANGLNLYLAWAKQKGYSPNEFYVLYYVCMAGECTQKDIGEEWSIPKQTISVVCKNLLDKGWLKYSENSKDKREKTLSLTELGESFVLPMVEELTAIEQRTAQAFGTAEFGKLLSDLVRLQRLFAQNLGQLT